MAVASATLTFDTASSSSPGEVAWLNPSNALASDNSRATVAFSLSDDQPSEFLHVTGLQRTLPPQAEIKGIQIDCEWRGFIGVIDATTIRLEENSVQPTGSDTFTRVPLPGGDTVQSHPINDTSNKWNAPFHDFNDLAARGFGAGIQTTFRSGGAGTQAQVDQVTATIHYNVPCRGRSRTLRRWTNGFR